MDCVGGGLGLWVGGTKRNRGQEESDEGSDIDRNLFFLSPPVSSSLHQSVTQTHTHTHCFTVSKNASLAYFLRYDGTD